MLSVICPVIVVIRYGAMKMTMSAIAIRFAIPRKSTRLYPISLTLVACDKCQLVDSTVFACSSVDCPALRSPPVTVAMAR